MPTLSQENYLKALYHLSRGGKVTIQNLARHLGVTAASALGMVRKLQARKLVTYRRPKGIELTRIGHRTALEIVRRHRLWEVFLHDKLDYRWDEVHAIAEELEHVAIPDLANRLDKFLGYPAYDPHGDPIPQHDGTVPPISPLVLAQQPYPARYRIVGLRSTDEALLHQLVQYRISIGQVVELRDRLPYDRTHVIRIGQQIKHIGDSLAQQLLVEHIS